MIIPEDLTLEELIGAMKANQATLTAEGDTDNVLKLQSFLNLALVIKRELDKKADK